MNGQLEKKQVEDFDVFNFEAIACLEQIGILTPSQAQIDNVEGFLKRAGQRDKGYSKFTQTYLKRIVDTLACMNHNKPKDVYEKL